MTVSPDLDRRFRDAAVTLDLVDVGFDVVDSSIGTRASRVLASSARQGRSTSHAASSASTSRETDARSTSRSTCAGCRPSRCRS